jgi:integrase
MTKMQTKRIPYTFNRRGYYYFTRRVPNNLQKHYKCLRIVQGLGTKSYSVAKTRALVATAKLDEYWSHLRIVSPELAGQHLLKQPIKETQSAYIKGPSVCLTDALNIYLNYKGKGRNKAFHKAAERACRYLIEATSLKKINEYTRQDALDFRDYLITRGLVGSSITRVFNALVSVVNFAISEYALDLKNPFTRVYHDRNAGVTKRLPIPIKNIRIVQNQCKLIDDDMRWLIALISDTGMRLAEAAGLATSDLILNHEVPHIIVQQQEWRSIKTSSSERKIPLVGAALWAGQRIISNSDNLHAFPRYNKSNTTNSNSASAALNKWLKGYVPEGCSVHSFRHSMRDRLRAVSCPTEMIDQIGGWSRQTVGQEYGDGYDLQLICGFMNKFK